jgi:hypothetical protein
MQSCILVKLPGSAGARRRCRVQQIPGIIVDDPVLGKRYDGHARRHSRGRRGPERRLRDEMNALFEFLITEPAICPTA